MKEGTIEALSIDSNEEKEEATKLVGNKSLGEEEIQNGLELKEFTPKTTTLKIALLAIFTALGVALSILFIYFPSIELMSLTLFIGGIILGPLYGMFLAVFAASLYELIATIMVGPGYIIFPFKIIAFLAIVLTGAILRKKIPAKPGFIWRFVFGVIGGLLTIFYDLITNVGWIILSSNFNFIGYISALVIGLPVTASRVASNTILFLFVPDIYNNSIKLYTPKT